MHVNYTTVLYYVWPFVMCIILFIEITVQFDSKMYTAQAPPVITLNHRVVCPVTIFISCADIRTNELCTSKEYSQGL